MATSSNSPGQRPTACENPSIAVHSSCALLLRSWIPVGIHLWIPLGILPGSLRRPKSDSCRRAGDSTPHRIGPQNRNILDGFARLAPWAPPGPLWAAPWATTSAEELPTSIFVGPPLQLSRFWVAKGAHFDPFWVAFRSVFARWNPNPVRVAPTGASNGRSKTSIF